MARGEQNEFVPYYINVSKNSRWSAKNGNLSMKINDVAAEYPLGRLSFRILVASANLPGVYKQRRELNSVLFFVIPERFERSTHALEGRCSIQRSYGTSLVFAFASAKVVLFCGKSNNFCKFISLSVKNSLCGASAHLYARIASSALWKLCRYSFTASVLKAASCLKEGMSISLRRSSMSPHFCNKFSARDTFMRVSPKMSARSSIFICRVLQPSCDSDLMAMNSTIFSGSGN